MEVNIALSSEACPRSGGWVPVRVKKTRPKKLRPLLAGAGGVRLQGPDALGERPAALGCRGDRVIGGGRGLRRRRFRSQHGLDRRIRPLELDGELCNFGGDVVDALAK